MTRKYRASLTKTMIFVRRLHLYTGLFLLPWVFLYGITGAMYNHEWLLPEVSIQRFSPDLLKESTMQDFPSPLALADQVVTQMQESAPEAKISISSQYQPQFTNDLMFEVKADDKRHIVHIDPVSHTSHVASHPQNTEEPQTLLTEVTKVQLSPNPLLAAMNAVEDVAQAAGIKGHEPPMPHGWSKLNFIAEIDGQPARVTYVLKDGFVKATRFTGDDGMTTRSFFMRLHTTHGQSPHWNGRLYWTFILDAMALAMVCWGAKGIVMWWQIKRTRLIGGIVIALSLSTATFLFLSVQSFYAHTVL